MLDWLREFLAPGYLYIKTVHLLAVTVWTWSTAAAYAYYLVPVMKAWRRNPGDAQVVALRDWAMERFDQSATYEHLAFPVVLITGPMLYLAAGWSTASGWLALKLLIVVGLFIPIEIIDYHYSHFGGNKRRALQKGGPASMERAINQHWLYLLVVSPVVMIFSLIVMILAVAKPL